MENVLLRDIQLPQTLKASIESKQQAEQEALAMNFRLQKEKQEAERKRIEAGGIRDFQQIVAQGISPQLLEWKGIEATETACEESEYQSRRDRQSEEWPAADIGSVKLGLLGCYHKVRARLARRPRIWKCRFPRPRWRELNRGTASTPSRRARSFLHDCSGRSAGSGGRIGLGEIRYLAGNHAAASRRRLISRDKSYLERRRSRPRPAQSSIGRHATAARLKRGHDFPGADDCAESGHARRRSDRRGVLAHEAVSKSEAGSERWKE